MRGKRAGRLLKLIFNAAIDSFKKAKTDRVIARHMWINELSTSYMDRGGNELKNVRRPAAFDMSVAKI